MLTNCCKTLLVLDSLKKKKNLKLNVMALVCKLKLGITALFCKAMIPSTSPCQSKPGLRIVPWMLLTGPKSESA